jgi:hypothetical protein
VKDYEIEDALLSESAQAFAYTGFFILAPWDDEVPILK